MKAPARLVKYHSSQKISANYTSTGLGRKPLRSNVVTPDIFVGPTWLHNDEPSTMEIIELNSSNEELSPTEPNRGNRRHAWSYVNDEEMQHIESSYKINKRAREKRRLQNTNHLTSPATYNTPEPKNWDNDIQNDFYLNHSHKHNEDKSDYNEEINYFDIINKHFGNSDSSTDEEYGEIEVITSADVLMSTNDKWNRHSNDFYNEEVITYDTDLDQETRTIWIYSFKNKHLLTGDEFEAVPNKESSSSSYSTDSSGEQTINRDTPGRLGSPTPATYIPRLNLSLVPTLSTVMEMSERNPTPDKTIKSTSRTTMKVHANNWCVSDSPRDYRRSVRSHEKSTNIINWMSLSPRERRRVLKGNHVSDTFIGSYLNLSEIGTDNIQEENGDLEPNEIVQSDAVKIQVDVEVHVNDKEANGDVAETEPKNANNAEIVNAGNLNCSNNIKYTDTDDFQKDRGDHDVQLVTPIFRFTPKEQNANISHPTEDTDNLNWIHEKEEKETNVYDYVLERSESTLDATMGNTVDNLWMKNTVPFLKPSHWTKFKPIADSPMSYHLSIGSIEERTTWFKRLINFLKCCK